MSDEVIRLLTDEERKAVESARTMTPLTLLMVVDTIKAEARLKAEEERDRALAVADSMQHFADVAERCERKSNEWAGRVARVEALADEWWGRASEATSAPTWRQVTRELRAALADTTPPATEETA